MLGGETVKLWRGGVVAGGGAPGEVLSAGDGGIVVACGDGRCALTELQRAGGRRTGRQRSFLRGWTPPRRHRFDAAIELVAAAASTARRASARNAGRVEREAHHVQPAEDRHPDGGHHRPVHGHRLDAGRRKGMMIALVRRRSA